jgi:hypothetical protein
LASRNRPPQTVLERDIQRFSICNRRPQTASTAPVPPTTALQPPMRASQPPTKRLKRELWRLASHNTPPQTVLQRVNQRAFERYGTHIRPPQTALSALLPPTAAQLPPMWIITYHRPPNHTEKQDITSNRPAFQPPTTRLSRELQRLASHNRPPQTVLQGAVERFASRNKPPQMVLTTPPLPPHNTAHLPPMTAQPHQGTGGYYPWTRIETLTNSSPVRKLHFNV